ncbi:hypothetical protein, partial [Yersinia sp. IP36721]|uniref:hypothetical protein n=1 Tax=Yersinia sp. IP36721 TaxID=2161716 RepID=UPI001969019B
YILLKSHVTNEPGRFYRKLILINGYSHSAVAQEPGLHPVGRKGIKRVASRDAEASDTLPVSLRRVTDRRFLTAGRK